MCLVFFICSERGFKSNIPVFIFSCLFWVFPCCFFHLQLLYLPDEVIRCGCEEANYVANSVFAHCI